MNSTPASFREEFPSLFKGLDKLKTEYHMTLQENASPFCLYNPRTISHPLLPRVRTEIESMLQLGVISPMSVPTG